MDEIDNQKPKGARVTKPPISSLPSAVACREGTPIPLEMYDQLFAGGPEARAAFVRRLMELARERADDSTLLE